MKAKLIFPSLTMTNADTMGGVTYRHSVNAGTDLQFGCAAMAEVSFAFRTANFADNVVFEGQTFTLQFSQTEDGTDDYETYGIFNVATVTKKGGKTSVTAYDNVYKFERDADAFLLEVTYPVTVGQYLSDLCAYCGVELADYPTTNMAVSLPSPIPVNGGTCRNLLADIAELAAGFAYCGADGNLRISWYRSNAMALDSSKYTSWTRAEYATDAITGVFIQSTGNPVAVGTAENRYVVNNNPLMNLLVATDSLTEGSDTAQNAAQAIYNAMGAISYVPMEIHLLRDFGVSVGDIVSVNGISTYIMDKTMKSSGVVLISTGNKARDASVTDTRQRQVSELYGIRQEFRAENNKLLSKIESYDGRFTSIEQDIDGLTLTAQSEVGGVTPNVDVGEYVDLGTTHGFAKKATSSSWNGYYYASNSASFPTGDVYAYTTAYGKIVFNFSRDTVVTVSSRVRGREGSSIRMSAVDVDMSVDGASAYAVIHTATTTATAYKDTINIPPGEHFVTFAYVRGTASIANYFSASFRFQADVPNPSAKSTIHLLKNGVEISTAEVVFDGLATTTELRAEFDAYVNGEEGKAAIKSAVEGTFITVDELQDYAKKDEIPDVSEFVTESSLSTSINQYINGTDGKAAIESVVSGTYATKDEIGNFVTSSEVSASIIQEIDALESKLTLSASVNGNSSTLTLKSGSAELSSAEITFDGFVTFTDLSTDGRTTISGGNIASNSITADKLAADEILTRKVLFTSDFSGSSHNIVSSSYLVSSANAIIDVGLVDQIAENAFQGLRLWGNEIVLKSSGDDATSDDGIVFGMNKHIIDLRGNGGWEIGTDKHWLYSIYSEVARVNEIRFGSDYYPILYYDFEGEYLVLDCGGSTGTFKIRMTEI